MPVCRILQHAAPCGGLEVCDCEVLTVPHRQLFSVIIEPLASADSLFAATAFGNQTRCPEPSPGQI